MQHGREHKDKKSPAQLSIFFNTRFAVELSRGSQLATTSPEAHAALPVGTVLFYPAIFHVVNEV